MDLNTFNHCPAWLSCSDFEEQVREASTLVSTLRRFDVSFVGMQVVLDWSQALLDGFKGGKIKGSSSTNSYVVLKRDESV